ncbi:MAG: metalloregulator ArsR/SmtB family transcription factor [Pseudomonadota bacterium]
MNLNQAARCLETLGNPTRLEIVRLLVRSGSEGLAVGEIQEHLGVPGSTLSHHLSHLVNSSVIEQEREGRVLRCRPNFQTLQGLTDFLMAECCQGVAKPGKRRKAG